MSRMYVTILMILSVIWGSAFYFVKILLTAYGPWSIAFFRCLFGLVTIAFIMFIIKEPFKIKKKSIFPMIVVSLLNTSIPWAFIPYGEKHITSSMASVLNATTPIWTILIGIFIFKSKSTKEQWLGVFIAFVGLILLLNIKIHSFISINHVGLIAIFIASFSYACASQFSKHFLSDISMYELTFGTLLGGTIGSGILAFSLESVTFHPLLSPPIFLSFIGIGIIGSGIAYIMFYYLIKNGKPEQAEMVTYFIPVSAILWGSLLLHEGLSWRLIVGLLFIIGGIVISEGQLSIRKKKTYKKIIHSYIKAENHLK